MSDKQVSTNNAPTGGKKHSTVPAERVLAALTQATAAITGGNPGSSASTVQADLANALEAMTPAPSRPIPDKDHKDPAIAPFWHQYTLDSDKAGFRYGTARSAAVAALDVELTNWSQAQSQYAFALGTADAAMATAVKAATDAYKLKQNDDSRSRSLYLYFTMKETIAAALQDYQKSVAAAAAVLAGEAGAVLGAYASFLGSVGAAQGNFLVDQNTAEQTYWQGVEQVRDAV